MYGQRTLIWFTSLICLTLWTRVRAAHAVPASHSGTYYKLFTGGISQLLWDEVLNIHSRNVSRDFLLSTDTRNTVSNGCISSLLQLRSRYEAGDVLPFQFIDSSARGQPALLIGTTSSFGDYDQCLDIRSSEDVAGKYCLVKFAIQSSVKSGIRDEIETRYPVADFYYPLHGLCVPSTCSREDLANILSHHIFPQTQAVKLLDISHCDTQESISFSLKRLNKHQLLAFIFVTTFAALSGIGTLFHILGIDFLRNHSALKQISDLLEPNRGNRIDSADAFKTVFALYGVAIHSIAAIVTPIGAFVLARIQNVCEAVNHVWLQPLINVHGLHVISFLGGLSVGSTFYPNAKKDRLSYGIAIFERFIRNAPGILCLLAIEFLWPFVGAGPIYTYVADDIVENCSNNWYLNVFFITNYNPVLKNCVNHTFWSSIDFQLFLMGLLIIACMRKSLKLGIAMIGFFAAIDFGVTGIMAHIYQTAHGLAAHPLTAPGIIHYVDYIHNQTTNYMFTFLAGLSVAMYLVEKGPLNVGTAGIIGSFIFMQLGAYSTITYNNYPHIFPKSTIPVFFAVVKICWAASNTLSIMYFAYRAKPPKDKKSETKEKPVEKKPEEVQEASVGYRLYLMISRLSTSMYLVNYWFIRYDFFTARQPFEITTINFFKRFGYSVCFSEILAFFFYVILLGPLDSYRKRVYTSKKKTD